MRTKKIAHWQIGLAVLVSIIVGLFPTWVYSLIWFGAVDTMLEKSILSTLGALMFAIYQATSWLSLCALWDRKVNIGPHWMRFSPQVDSVVSHTLDNLTGKVGATLFTILAIFEFRVWLH